MDDNIKTDMLEYVIDDMCGGFGVRPTIEFLLNRFDREHIEELFDKEDIDAVEDKLKERMM